MTDQEQTKRVAIYLRVSSVRQEEKGVSLDVQRERCLAAVRAQPAWVLTLDEDGDDPDGLFVDVQSGLETEKRAGYQRLLAACRARRVDVILVYRYDRLGRDDAELIARGKELGRLKVQRLSVTEGERDDFMLKLGDLLAHRESAEISKRVTPAMRKRAEQGLWTSRNPYGYLPDAERGKGYLKVDEDAAAIVRELFRRAAEGVAVHALVNWLNTLTTPAGQRLQSPRGGYFSTQWVRYVLTNPVYLGQVRQGMKRHSRIDGVYARPVEEQYHGQGLQPALIEQETFDRVQALIATHPPFRKRATDRQWLLTGMVRCAVCGRRMQGRWVIRADQRERGVRYTSYRYYCARSGHGVQGGKRLDAYVLEQVARLAIDPEMVATVQTILAARQQQQPERITEVKATRARLERRLKDATDLLLDGTLSREVYRQQREAIEAQIAESDRELATLVQPARATQHIAAAVGAWLERAGDLRALLAQATLGEKAAVVAGAIHHITVSKGQTPAITWQPWAEEVLAALDQLGAA
jgi:site-specific DNA recombinase